jgi:hypothetical protein
MKPDKIRDNCDESKSVVHPPCDSCLIVAVGFDTVPLAFDKVKQRPIKNQ